MTVPSGALLDLATTLQEGLSVVDPAGPLTRTWYFDGRFLRADGFRVDQAYERALAGFVARGAGTGVLHGFDVDLGTGDTLSVDAGLALSPSGRVVLLTRQVHLSTATLISRTRGTLDPGEPSEATGHSSFAPCPPEVADDGVPVLPDTTLWVLTAAPNDALCGEEERFGQLCADACATETDRSQAVEGVLFRLRPVVLTLPTPRSVTMTAIHLRSRVASAWFAAERIATASIVSGAGLRSPLWCRGAEAAGGEEVPLGVLHRQGAASVWVDAWTARRELLEPTPRRYWDARTARRPLSVGAAQLLQFQCQLGQLDVADVSQVSGSALLDAGLVELPSAGYLAVDPAGDVRAQLRTRFGPGVDLRLCVGRADVVPELLEEARHRERISLTRGLDDPGRLEHVDVLVPDGEIAQTSASIDALVGETKVLPARRDGDTGSAMSLATVARDSSETGWTWAAVAAGQLPKRALPDPVMRFVRGQPRRRRRVASVDAAVRDLISADRPAHVLLGRDVFAPGTRGDEGREIAVWAQISSQRIDTMGKGDLTDVRARACFVAAVDDLSVFDARFTGEMRVVSRVLGEANGRPTVQLEAVLDGFVDVFTVDNGTPRSRVTPIRAMAVRWAFGTDEDGAERLAVALLQGGVVAAPTGLALIATRLGTPQTIKAVLARVGLRREVLDLVVRPTPDGDPDEGDVRGEPGRAPDTGWTSGLGDRFSRIFERLAASGVLGGTGFRAGFGPIGPIGPIGPMPGLSPIATAEVTDTVGAATPGTPTREGADTAIELISAALAAQGRDPGFAVGARTLLYGAPTGHVPAVRATRDWVLFHRRREVTCPGPLVVEPTTRTLRLLHSTLDSEERVKQLIERLRSGQPLDDAGFGSVVDVEFPKNSAQITSSVTALRQVWQATPRPPALGMLVAADGGDGPTVALARIDAVRSALTGLVDSRDAETGFLPTVPPEFAALGIDGVLLSAGVLAIAQPTTCVRLLRLSRSDMARLLKMLRALQSDPGPTLEELMAGEQIPVDPVSARFQDGTLDNARELETWWKNSEALQVIVVTPTDLGDGSDPLDARISRAQEALAALALNISSTLEVPLSMPPCGVTALVSVAPVQ